MEERLLKPLYVFYVADKDWKANLARSGGCHETDVNRNNVVEHIPAQLFVNEGLLCFFLRQMTTSMVPLLVM